jgi:hypothetical protein
VAIGQQSDHQTLYQVFLAYNHLVHFHADEVHEGTLLLDALVELSYIYGLIHKN